MTRPISWTKESVDFLREQWGLGASATEIADAITASGREWARITPGAVTMRAQRMGLAGRGRNGVREYETQDRSRQAPSAPRRIG